MKKSKSNYHEFKNVSVQQNKHILFFFFSKPSMAADPSEDSNSPLSDEHQSPDSENDPSNQMDFQEEDDHKGPPKLFALNLVNSYGNSQIIELVNDGNPIKIKCKEAFYLKTL